ncbi:MAG: hypothetical protein L6R39_002339 [Caloplaca ligustica]|nr:MAG: hypothetical protein L6R39_002339 [Caloplaca ligustica]
MPPTSMPWPPELDHACRELVQGFESVLQSGRGVDMTVICENQVLRYHSGIVCPRSTFFANAIWGTFKEGETKTVILKEKLSMVRRMMRYFYVLDYDDQDDGALSDLEVNAQMYAMADQFNANGLKNVAAAKFARRCDNIISSPARKREAGLRALMSCATTVYTSTPDSDKMLRSRLARAAKDVINMQPVLAMSRAFEDVPAGTPFTITWTNTTTGFVNIELLRGPSTNIVPIQCLAERIPNSGSYVWTPSPNLEADVTHYGLRIVDSKTGQYQFSNQFGISNDVIHPPSSSLAPTTYTAATSATEATDGQVQVPTSSPEHTTTTSKAATTTASIPILANTTTTSAIVSSIGVSTSSVIIATTHAPIPIPSGSGIPQTMTVLQPSKNMTVPASLKTSKTQNPTRVTASASASFVSSSNSGTGSPIAGPTGTSAANSGAGKVLAGSMLAGLGALAAFAL